MTSYREDAAHGVDLPATGWLKWRCRRGMRELDSMLTAYLDHDYPSASAQERQAFVTLLGKEDDQLWDWLSGRVVCTDKEVAAIVREIRATR